MRSCSRPANCRSSDDPKMESDVRMRAVIFDFGGVFIDSPFAVLSDVARERGVSPDDLALGLFGRYDIDEEHPWHRLERGELSLEDARRDIMAANVDAGGISFDPFELLSALADGGVRDEMVSYCRSLGRRGFVTGLLTNNASEFADFWRPLIPLDELFDDVVDSSEVGLRKPDPAIYLLAMERLGVTAEQTVFIDDAPGNVAAARALGIASVLIGQEPSDVTAAIKAVEDLLGGPGEVASGAGSQRERPMRPERSGPIGFRPQ